MWLCCLATSLPEEVFNSGDSAVLGQGGFLPDSRSVSVQNPLLLVEVELAVEPQPWSLPTLYDRLMKMLSSSDDYFNPSDEVSTQLNHLQIIFLKATVWLHHL